MACKCAVYAIEVSYGAHIRTADEWRYGLRNTRRKAMKSLGSVVCTKTELTEYRRMVNNNEYGVGIFSGTTGTHSKNPIFIHIRICIQELRTPKTIACS